MTIYTEAFFEAEPIPDNIRKAGIGGVNRYKNLERFKEDSEIVVETTKKLDRLAKQAVHSIKIV